MASGVTGPLTARSRRFRFAPSPTGHLHLGNVRTALLAWLQARSVGGTFILRVEDLDRGRVRKEYVETQLLDLEWLGLDWDEGPGTGDGAYFQSARTDIYDAAIEALLTQRRAYECWCSRREIGAAASAPHALDQEGPPYPGTCRARTSSGAGPAALRFVVDAGQTCFDDLVQGRQCFDPATEVGDFVIRRRDGIAAYQLAVVVDDAEMRITDVLRGSDLLSSTARQLQLYRALGLSAPARWAHVPLMLDRGGDRLAKRQGSLTVQALRASGISAERIVGWLAFTCGLTRDSSPTRAADLVESFDLGHVERGDTVVDLPSWLG